MIRVLFILFVVSLFVMIVAAMFTIVQELAGPPECHTRYTFYDADGVIVHQEMGQRTYLREGNTFTIYLCNGVTKTYSMGLGWTMTMERIGEE